MDAPPRREAYPVERRKRSEMTEGEWEEYQKERARAKWARHYAKRDGVAGQGRWPAKPGAELVARDDSVAVPVSLKQRAELTGAADLSRARITVAPAFVDRRFHMEPGHRGIFSQLGVGVYLPEEETAG